jgi:hypothetical protein
MSLIFSLFPFFFSIPFFIVHARTDTPKKQLHGTIIIDHDHDFASTGTVFWNFLSMLLNLLYCY